MIYVWDNGLAYSSHHIEFVETDLPHDDVLAIFTGEFDCYQGDHAEPNGHILAWAKQIEWRTEGNTMTLDRWVGWNIREWALGDEEPHERVKRAIALCKQYRLGGWAKGPK